MKSKLSKLKKNQRIIRGLLDENVLKMDILSPEWSVRTYNCLRMNLEVWAESEPKIKTIGDFLKWVDNKPRKLLRWRNFGRKSLVEVDQMFRELGLKLNWNIYCP
jgi:DNA-directed RNA polymerase alpha subunit